MKHQTIKLDQCCECITDGDHLPPPKADSGIPFITISNIDTYNKIDFSNSMYVPERYYEALKDIRKARKGDILYSVVGSFGVPVLLDDNRKFCFQRHIALLRPNASIDCRFLYYVMKSAAFYAQADTVALGAAQRTISLTSLRNMTISVPDLPIQRRIADILSAYDDLIKNNRKQMKLLEEAAQRLYKEWFVDLHFPGWETTPIVDGLPEGWKVSTFGEICVVIKDTLKPGQIEAGVPYIGLEHIPKNDICLSDWGDSTSVDSNKFAFQADDVLFGKIRPYFHKVGFTLCEGICSTDAIVMRTSSDLWALLLMCASSDAFVDYTYQTCKEGAKMPRADWNTMKVYGVKIADAEVMAQFNDCIWSISRQLKALALQNRSLSQARDALLPKLMGGEIEV